MIKFVSENLTNISSKALYLLKSFFNLSSNTLISVFQDGLEAPPAEELPDPDLLDANEDLSYASMFASASGHDEERGAAPLTVDIPDPTPAPKPKALGSIALGGLLAASTPSEAAFSSGPLSSTGGSFLDPSSSTSPLHLPFPTAPRPFGAPAPAPTTGTPSSGGGGGAALTPQELEAQLRGRSAAAPSPPGKQQQLPQQQQQQQMPPYPYPGMVPGQPPPPGYMQPGPGSYPPHMRGPPPPLPQMQHQPQAGVFTPEMIMQQQQQQQQQRPQFPGGPGGPPRGPPPPHMMQMHHPHQMGGPRPGFGPPDIRGKKYGEVTMEDLIKESFRQRPDYLIIGEVRGKGCLLGMEAVKDKKTREPFDEAGRKIYQKAFAKGLAWIPAGHNLRMSPPLIMEEDVAEKALDIIDQSITEVEKEYGY